MNRWQRRDLLKGALLAPLLVGASSPRTLWAAPRFTRNPFSLGVASGYPVENSVVLWTRLAPEPLAPNGGMPPDTVPVQWELAFDERFRKIARRGVAYAEPEWVHSVHVEPQDLEPGREYWYRFNCGGVRSPVGRTWTAPKFGAPLDHLRIAVANCQQYEHGYYVAYRRMLEDHPDLILHLGDYIYEQSWGDTRVRHHDAPECHTLGDYRARHALYRSDPDLQAAHAACPWLLTWDDHEVDNDYAAGTSEQNDLVAAFLQRRAAAYRAYYEHLPLPRRMVPVGPDMQLYTACGFGNLAAIFMLDERQYRTPHACPRPGSAGSNRITPESCSTLLEESRTLLGQRQEAWLAARMGMSQQRWNLLSQGVVMAYANEEPKPARRYWTDGWNGYPAARARLMQQLHSSQIPNPLVLSGDIHAFIAADLRLDPADPATPMVASELTSTSITSQASPEALLKRYRELNSDIRLADSAARGYLRLDLTPGVLRADLIAMDTVLQRHSNSRVLRSFTIEDGVRGLRES